MKSLIFLFVLSMLGFTTMAQLSRSEKRAVKEKEIRELIESRHYRFVANKALPMGGGSINLTSEYDLIVDSTRVKAYLPFFGVAYRADYGNTQGGIKFNSAANKYSCELNKKKGIYMISMEVKGEKDIYQLHLDAGVSAYATLSITSNDKQNISYYGVIEKIE